MADWDQERYLKAKSVIQNELSRRTKTPAQYMLIYKAKIEAEDYETAKAIDEILVGYSFYVTDTHRHIELINKKYVRD